MPHLNTEKHFPGRLIESISPPANCIECRLRHSSLGARDLRMERDYHVIVLRDLAQRIFHIAVNGRGDRLPRPGIEVLHRRYGSRVNIDLPGEKPLGVRILVNWPQELRRRQLANLFPHGCADFGRVAVV